MKLFLLRVIGFALNAVLSFAIAIVRVGRWIEEW